MPADKSPKKDKWESSSESGSTVILDTPRPSSRNPEPIVFELDLPRGTERGRSPRLALESYLDALLEGGHRQRVGTEDSDDSDTSTHNVTSTEEKPKHYYKYFVLPKKFLKVRFDRLAILVLLDRWVSRLCSQCSYFNF